MRLSLDVLRARKGDCLMLHYGSASDPHLIMIDGGPSNVYKPQLKPRLARIRALRKISEEAPLPVDAVMISHVDDDHIQGILELTQDLLNKNALPMRVGSLWHNTFDDILKTTPSELTAAAGFGAAALAGEIEVAEHHGFDAVQVLVSIPQGRQLRDDAKVLGWTLNDKFGKKLILATSKTKAVKLDGGVKLTIAGPMQPELAALQKDHDKWLAEQKKKKSPAAALVAFVDASVPNLSSIVVLVEAGGKRILLTGDARGDKILRGLELTGVLKAGASMRVDILKVPHHGSSNNLDTQFFRRITARHYVFSGDGEHGNPERESLQMLLDACGNSDFTMHFTYPIKEIDEGREADWNKEQQKEKNAKKKNPQKKVRPNWSRSIHSLAGLFEANPTFARKVSVVEDGKPHVIDLLDPLGL